MERVKKIKYIDNDETLGIDYDWNLISKEYKKLGVPKEYDITELIPLGTKALKWYILTSERSVGKTTNVLLIGMVMNALYGTVIQLIRHSIAKASYYDNLFSTMIAYKNGQYIRRLTNDKFNSVKYFWKGFYYSFVDEKGKVIRDDAPFCVSLESSECYNLCSCYEAPLGDWIVLDECFNDSNRPEEFVHFIHLHKTIVRDRMSDKIIVLGNNLDINNIWYRQLTIHNEMRKMKKGMCKTVKTVEGMPIFVSFMENRMPIKRRIFNQAHYGFNNSEINAITGNGEWNIKQYPLTCMLKDREMLVRGIYFSYHDDLYLEASYIKTSAGIFLEVHPTTIYSARNGDVVYTLTFSDKDNELFFGNDKLSKRILQMIANKKIVFSDNETGDLFSKFIMESIKKQII